MNVSPSLFGESKLIEVEGLESMNDAFLADALGYLQHPEQDAVLFFGMEAASGARSCSMPSRQRVGRLLTASP